MFLVVISHFILTHISYTFYCHHISLDCFLKIELKGTGALPEFLAGSDPEAVHNLCLILKIVV
jgi:hypothetical protein